MEDSASGSKDKDPYSSSKASRFEFKSTGKGHSKRRHRSHGRDKDNNESSGKKEPRVRDSSRHRHRDSKRRRRHHASHHDRTFTHNGAYEDPDHRYRESMYDGLSAGEADPSSLDPDAAFRESLFDAMADDEGAAYWEGVYGQPLHIYPNTKPGPDGELERMTDDEYAEYVRVKMWEKSHQHILDERAAKERLRKKEQQNRHSLEEDIAKEERERDKIRREVEASLKRGEERKRRKEAETYWNQYLSRWNQLKSNMPAIDTAEQAREMIPWPVASGKIHHLDGDEIERFLKASGAWTNDPVALLKIERIRWHPDKMQQRFGQHIDSDTMKSVTAVFQVIDRLWNEYSER